MRSSRFRVSLLIVSHSLCFVKYFFRFFQNLFLVFDRSAFATAILLYHIEFALSRTFFIFFQDFFVPASLRSPRSRFAPIAFPRQLFSLYRAAFCAFPTPSLCDSFTILPLHSPNVKHFFLLFLCLLNVLYLPPLLSTFGTKLVLMFSTVITFCILQLIIYYCLCFCFHLYLIYYK